MDYTKYPILVAMRTRLSALPRSVLLSIALVAAMVLWILSGLGGGNEVRQADSIAAQDENTNTELFAVQTQEFIASAQPRLFQFRARTEAERIVNLAAETQGIITALPAAEGDYLEQGALVCRIDMAARRAQYQEAEAMMRSREIDYQASRRLLEKGYISRSQAASDEAAYDAARALLQQRRIEIARTQIAMPFDAIVDAYLLEVGDFVGVGQPCVRLIDKDPLLVTAQIAEREVAHIRLDMPARATLATGETVEGRVRYIAEMPSPETRTYRVEVEVRNPNLTLRDGVSAEVEIVGEDILAHKLPQNILTLSDDGQLGVKVVVDEVARFKPITIIRNDVDGAWVTGLNISETLIIIGQDFVTPGQKVKTVKADALAQPDIQRP